MTLPLATRALLFLYSTRNIVGCLFALVGIALFLGEIIDHGWLAIVAGLYLGGFLIVPARSVLHEIDVQALSDDALLDGLDRLQRATRMQLPDEAHARLGDIRATAAELLPRLRSTTRPAVLEQLFAVNQALGRDLPITVDNYLRLPAAFAAVHPIDKGRTARQLLQEQLDLLHGHLARMLESALKDDADAMVNNGRFLREKFHKVDFITGG